MSSDIKMSQANAFDINKEFRPIYSSGSQPRGPAPPGDPQQTSKGTSRFKMKQNKL